MSELAFPAKSKVAWISEDGDSCLSHGDCLQGMKSLRSGSIDCVWTDPPYFLSNDGMTCVGGRMVKVNKGEWDRSRGLEQDHEFNRTWLAECHRVLKPSGVIWVTGTHHVYLSVGIAMREIGYRILNDIVWQKTNPPPNLGRRCFTHSTELVLWATKAKKGSPHRYTFHYDQMREENGGKQMKNVWAITAAGRAEKKHGKHPTQKPLALIERCLRASTNPGDVILDPFSGSGSTGVAALGMGRKFIGYELQEEFVELAARRLAKYASDEAPPVPNHKPGIPQSTLFESPDEDEYNESADSDKDRSPATVSLLLERRLSLLRGLPPDDSEEE